MLSKFILSRHNEKHRVPLHLDSEIVHEYRKTLNTTYTAAFMQR